MGKFRGYCVCLAIMLWLAAGAITPAFAQQRGFYYVVRDKETLAILAGRFGLSDAELANANRLTTSAQLVAGSRIWVPGQGPSRPASPSVPSSQPRPVSSSPRTERPTASAPSSSSTYTVRPGDSLWKVARQYGLTVEQLAKMNGMDPSAPLKVGQKLTINSSTNPQFVDIPGGGLEMASSKPRERTPEPVPESSTSTVTGSGSTKPSRHGFIWPVEGRILREYRNTSDEKHMGINIAVPKGTEVRAAKDGKVVYADDTIPYYGRMVIITHDGGLASCYAMNDRLLVREGQRVKTGQVIARSGDAGRGGDAYLHFEIRKNGDAIDPNPYLP